MTIVIGILIILSVIAWIKAIKVSKKEGETAKKQLNTWVMIGAVLTVLSLSLMFIVSQNV
ncbi:hypothetical protein MTQ94_08425 [Staphylococcus agnetis]|uniref:Mid2-like cell wall stress sensor domain protein n=1 Tax=Staphylococcus agnetis TaxID=985762 RepID=A0ABD7TUZ1_9STAP|nr:hypothetical protein [Staphylococcus agnetis]KFE41138.1 hypothetical protein SAGN_09447 [Staphylococcus agnetis]MCO4338559.1 hypothetical protein [Staphylococcus agnetis]MCO4340220.1 hypothetical protein [Staphylococcus agnetis]MCO4343806.1 hypothetical protein [Staphylococcus agnetis]MCO4345508.1 hypothetical protein [Staphylococcus agnetis]